MRTLLVLLFFVSSVFSCDWLDNIKEKRVKVEMLGKGLHRELSISTKIASLTRFSECRLLYEIDLPSGAYVDSDNVNASLKNHALYARHRFNVEAPEADSQAQKVVVVSTEVLRKTFLIKDALSVPVKIRYHAAKDGDNLNESVSFRTPIVALDCPQDYSTYKLEKCPGKRKYDKFGVTPPSSGSWILIEPLEKVSITASVPVGNLQMLPVVLGGTIITVFVAFAVLCIGTKTLPILDTVSKKTE